jgi:hypothetical protein
MRRSVNAYIVVNMEMHSACQSLARFACNSCNRPPIAEKTAPQSEIRHPKSGSASSAVPPPL